MAAAVRALPYAVFGVPISVCLIWMVLQLGGHIPGGRGLIAGIFGACVAGTIAILIGLGSERQPPGGKS